jgi:pimeloyl-ACP methyl ester carboxylesterase
VIDYYDWPGGREAMLRFGPDRGPVVIAATPFFEEANRTRAFLVTILRALAARGISGALPDLPGAGESLIETEKATLTDWRTAFLSAAAALDTKQVHTVALRGGALLDADGATASCWHFAPVTGAALVRDLLRTRLAAGTQGGTASDTVDFASPGPPIELAGNRISRRMLAELDAAIPSIKGRLRTIRLESDAQPADAKVAGAPLWRRTEPDNDPALAAFLADDIATWVTTCAV